MEATNTDNRAGITRLQLIPLKDIWEAMGKRDRQTDVPTKLENILRDVLLAELAIGLLLGIFL